MNYARTILLAFLLLGGVAARPTPGDYVEKAHVLLQERKTLSAVSVLSIEDADFAERLKAAGFWEYLDGKKELRSVRLSWPHQLEGAKHADRLRSRFDRLLADLPQRYRPSSPFRLSQVGEKIQFVVVDPGQDARLQAYLHGVDVLEKSPEISTGEQFKVMVRLALDRIHGENGSTILRLGESLQGRNGSTGARLTLLKLTLERTGYRTRWQRRSGKTYLQVRTAGVYRDIGGKDLFSSTEVVEVEVKEGNLEVRHGDRVLESTEGIYRGRESVILETSPQVRFPEYPEGRRVHLFDPKTGKARMDGVVRSQRGNSYRVGYGRGEERTVTRQELDLFNAHLDLPDGTVVKPARHFYEDEYERNPRAQVRIDAREDAWLRSFEAEMEMIGRASGMAEEAKLDYLMRSVNAWLNSGNAAKDSWDVDHEAGAKGRTVLLGEFMKNGSGVCRHRSLLAQRGAMAMGFHTRYVSGGGHSTIDVILRNGERWKVDPFSQYMEKKTFVNTPESYLLEPRIHQRTLLAILGGRPEGIPTPQEEAAGAQREYVDRLWDKVWTGRFRFQDEWGRERYGVVPVKQGAYELVWFNPTAAIMELDINAGDVLDAEDRSKVEKILGVERAPNGTGADGKAAHPANVGRAFNPAPGSLTVVIGDGRHQRTDLTVKGTGNNKPDNPRGDGTLELSEALLDAEISLRLQEAGVRTYLPVAVLRNRNNPEKAIYWRMPVNSLVRADDLVDRLLTPEEAMKTLEVIARDASQFEGRTIGVAEFLESYYPRMMGENAGRMRQLGVHHGTIQYPGYGNSGIAEVVDFGSGMIPENGTELVSGRGDANRWSQQKEDYLRDVERVVEHLRSHVPEGVSSEEVRRQYEQGYRDGQQAIRSGGQQIWFSKKLAKQFGEQDLRNLVRGLDARKSESARSKKDLIKILENGGFVRPDPSGQLEPARDPRLEELRNAGHRVRDFVRREGPGAGKFAAAFLLKESLKGVPHLAEAADQLRTAEFWKSFGTFTVASRATERVMETRLVSAFLPRAVRNLTRTGIPLAAGMAASDLVMGEKLDGRRVGVSTASFLVAGTATDVVMNVIVPALRCSAPASNWVLDATKLGLTLYAGEKIEQGVYSLAGWGEARPLRRVPVQRAPGNP